MTTLRKNLNTLRLCLFWLKTNSGNDFPKNWVFGCYFKFDQTEKHFQLTENYSQNNGKWYPLSYDFRPWKIEEREREREREQEDHRHRSKTIALLRSFKPTLVEPSHRSLRSSRHFRTTREERDREGREIVAPPARSSCHRSRTRSHQIADKPTRIASIAPPSRTTNPRTRYQFVLILVWNFCNKICLWFWFFTFSLWSLILLLLLWLCGWWCFGGFPVVWWLVLCGWWWKIAFSECYQTHEIIF